jgi:hypothetical protein
MEDRVGKLQDVVDGLCHQVENLEKNLVLVATSSSNIEAVVKPDPSTSLLSTPPIGVRDGPNGHCFDHDHQGKALGSFTTQTPPPVISMPVAPQFTTSLFNFSDGKNRSSSADHSSYALVNHVPKLDFPMFDGEHPHYWKRRCEDHFGVCAISPELWVRLATYHFSRQASLCLQS